MNYGYALLDHANLDRREYGGGQDSQQKGEEYAEKGLKAVEESMKSMNLDGACKASEMPLN